jgi:hypothetical protein
MIELFDQERLLPRRDPTLWAAATAVLLTVAGLAAYAQHLQRQWQQGEQATQQLQARLRLQLAQAPVNPALLADLQQQVLQLETALAAAQPPQGPHTLSPGQWLDRLDALAAPGLSLRSVDLEPAGSARVLGQASSAQVINQFVQAWSRQDQVAQWAPRSIEVRQDSPAPGTGPQALPGPTAQAGQAAPPAAGLRFELRAARPGTAASAPSAATPANLATKSPPA